MNNNYCVLNGTASCENLLVRIVEVIEDPNALRVSAEPIMCVIKRLVRAILLFSIADIVWRVYIYLC
jgi:hypothetical protein